MAKYIQACGCRISIDTDAKRYEWSRIKEAIENAQILYCPKHGAAPELYFVVKAALRYIPEGTPTFEDAQYAINLADKE